MYCPVVVTLAKKRQEIAKMILAFMKFKLSVKIIIEYLKVILTRSFLDIII